MSYFLNLKRGILAALVWSGSTVAAWSAGALVKSGLEYRLLPSLPGDQVESHLALGAEGGYVVTQDGWVDGSGLGVRARRIYPDLSGGRTTFQVNSTLLGDQQNARVALLQGGGAVFAWESSTAQGRRIYVRFMGANETFLAPELAASGDSGDQGDQTDVRLAVLANGTVVAAWSEWGRDGSMQGVFAQLFSATGNRVGGVIRVNQVGSLNQRSPALAALSNGQFVVAWVSEEQRHANSVDIYARIFSNQGAPIASEFRLNSGERICANPSLVAAGDGFRAAWSARSINTPSGYAPSGPNPPSSELGWAAGSIRAPADGWDVETRAFGSDGTGSASEAVVNTMVRGDQFAPQLATAGRRQMIVWTSFGQDGADEGVYARLIGGQGEFESGEFLVNTRTRGKQLVPSISSLGGEILVVMWSSFTGGAASFDLFAQNYRLSPEPVLAAPAAPMVSSLSQTSICVAWPELLAQPVAAYLVYLDDAAVPLETSAGMLTLQRPEWAAGSAHTVRLAYRLADGRISPPSDSVTVQTWGADANGDQLPDDWQTVNWGKRWPAAGTDSDLDGASNLDEFLAGTDPTNPESVLRVEIKLRELGLYLEWRTEAGNYYQLQATSDFRSWRNVDGARFSPSTSDSIPVAQPGTTEYYRVIRMR